MHNHYLVCWHIIIGVHVYIAFCIVSQLLHASVISYVEIQSFMFVETNSCSVCH